MTYLICKKEGLQQGIHVASGSLILKPHITCVLLWIPAYTMRGLSIHMDFKGDGIILAVASLRVQHFIPIHEVTKTPIILLAKK